MEEIYKLRDKDDRLWAWFFRVKAYWHQDQAKLARQESMPLLASDTEMLAPSFKLVQEYFVLGDYHRRFDNAAKAEEYFALARSVQWVDDDSLSQTGSEYIEDLIKERLDMMQRQLPSTWPGTSDWI